MSQYVGDHLVCMYGWNWNLRQVGYLQELYRDARSTKRKKNVPSPSLPMIKHIDLPAHYFAHSADL